MPGLDGVYIPIDKDDTHDVVAIGKDAYSDGDLDDSRGAVIIGRNVAKNMVSGGGGNVLVGVDLLSSSTRSDSLYNVIMGRNACQNHLLRITNNVIIGNQAMRDGSEDSILNNVIIGSDSCRGKFVGSGVVAVGRRAGYRSSSSTTTMGDNAIMIGSDTNSGDANIGAYSIAIGTANGQGITDDSVCIGRQAVCQGSATGQMVLGNNSYNKTMVLCTSESTKIKTGAGGTLLTSLELTTDNATMNSNVATTLTCGTNSLQVLPDKCTFSNKPIVLANPVICDSDGKSLFVGNSKWFSGRSDGLAGSSAEVRRINIPPSCFNSDDDSSTRSSQVYALETSTEYYPSEFTSSQNGYDGYAGMRVQTSSDIFLYFPQNIPDGWKVIGCRVEVYDRTLRASRTVLMEVFSRNIDADNAAITIHVNKTDLQYTGTSINFTTHYTPHHLRYLVGYIGNGSASHVFTGGWMSITRV